ncbi:MAG: ClpXP protease specificity-enhancing factor [Pseudomonadota bacterium]|nr:ClpXP protease specificity-enhancing factor [Pseudomonadota bacterium]
MTEISVTPTRPYLLKAIYEWIQDNHLTPYLLVNADEPNVSVPRQHVKDGQIVLNIAAHAVHQLHMDADAISFSARFGGVSQQVYAPMRAVMGLYARENGQGLFFDPNEYPALAETAATAEPQSEDATPKKSGLRILD